MRLRPLALLATLPLVVAACGSPGSVQAEAAREPAAVDAGPPTAAVAGPEEVRAGRLLFTAPTDWIEEAPANAMRKAQYRLAGAEGAGDASLIVYHFGASGGSVQANLERWYGQFEQPDGRPSAEAARVREYAVGGMRVHELDLAGDYVAETAPGSGERVLERSWRMLACIVESDHGPYYVKLVGPAATVAAREAGFRAFVGSLRRADEAR